MRLFPPHKIWEEPRKEAGLLLQGLREEVVPRPDSFEKMRKDPEVVALTLDLYFNGLSLRKVAKHLREVHYKPVSHVAVYKWARNFVKLISEFVYELRPELCGIWYADEVSLKVRGWSWLRNVMDRDTRFLLASIVTSERDGGRD